MAQLSEAGNKSPTLRSKIAFLAPFTLESIKFGISLKEKDVEFLVNSFIILAKYDIHKCKWSKRQPCLDAFRHEISAFKKSLGYKSVKGARDLLSAIGRFDLL